MNQPEHQKNHGIRIGSTEIYYYPQDKIGQGATSIVYKGQFSNLAAAIKEVKMEYLTICENE